MGIDAGGAAPNDLASRSVAVQDIATCLAMLRGGAAYPDPALPLIARAWRRLLSDEALIASVVERATDGGQPTILSFGASVFVDPDWAAAAVRSREPHLALRTIRAELRGRSPILRPDEVGRQQALNLLVLHYAEARSLTPPAAAAVRYRTFQAFLEAHRGFAIDCALQEFWDEMDPEFILNGWGRVINDYDSYWQDLAPEARPARRPYLVGISRADVVANPGNIAAPLFLYAPPRFGFSRGEQRLLKHALIGQTDVELARDLGVALTTVKSRWRSIYDRVGRQVPEIMPPVVQATTPRAARGREKRRRLLGYLREHP
jgi:hypothetical protein